MGRRERVVAIVKATCSTLLLAAALLALVAWAVGELATDRWRWSQFLWWCPWFVYAAAALPGVVFGWRSRAKVRRRCARIMGIAIVGIVSLGLWRDTGLGTRSGTGPSLTIVQWNASWVNAKDAPRPNEALRALNADIILVSNPFRLFNVERTEVWRADGYDVRQFGTFAVVSRVPIESASLLFSEGRVAGLGCNVDTTASLGRPISIVLLDLPSNPRESRNAIAHRARREIDRTMAAPPDVIAGDFNITRGSNSLSIIAPDYRNAWCEGGIGWGASWPRPTPILQLDHVLVAPSIAPASARFVDLGTGSHLAQVVTLRPRALGSDRVQN